MYQQKIAGLLVVALLATAGLVIRLFGVAVFHHKEFVAKAEQQQNVERDILPRRGQVWLQDLAAGHPALAAESLESYALSATPKNVVRKEEYARTLAQFAGTDEADLREELESDSLYMRPIKHGFSKQQVEELAAKLNEVERRHDASHRSVKVNFDAQQGDILYFIGGVFFVREFERAYPEGRLAAQALGFVNDHGKGQYGFEEQYDEELRGYGGKVLLEQDSVGTLLARQGAVASRDGTSYELSIDRNVQFVAERELEATVKDAEAQSGSVVAIDPRTGGIIALANYPTFNPNTFREVKQEEVGNFDNAAVSKIWEPGSIFKPLIMSAALDLGLVDAKTENTFDESVTVGGHKIETALRKAYGKETMAQVLANSDNVAMVWVANKLGDQSMYDYLRKYGFGQYTGVDLKNETAGSLLPVGQWRDINRATMSFGQGIAVSPLQVATAYAAIANGGRIVKPHIVKAVIEPDGRRREVAPEFGEQVIKPEVARTLRDMMVYTVVTAHNRAGTAGYKIGGKTGTAQIPDPEHGGYIADAYNHSFVGIGPSDDPRYVLLVKIDRPNLQKVGLFAESTAVPLFNKISSFLLNYYQIPPTNR